MIRFAFGSVPKDGGTFTFYRNLRPALLVHGIDMRCVAVGKSQADLWEDHFADSGCVLLAPDTRNIKQQAITFVNWCEQEKIDVVMGINSEAILSSISHLPERIRVLSRCANGFDHGYRITLSGKERLARIITVTPRLSRDLADCYGIEPSLLQLIPNGIDSKPFEQASATERGHDPELRLGFLGRLEHNQKGVFHLPKIVRILEARGIAFRFEIAGKGKHRQILEREMSKEVKRGKVKFLGTLLPQEIPDFLARQEVFLFTSHFEGCPNALLEAMMAGCVPVAWQLEGITDYLIQDGVTGLLSPMGNHDHFARHIASLAENRKRLQVMSKQGSYSARERFTNQKTALAYAALINDVMSNPAPSWQARPWSEFKVDPNFAYGWRGWLMDGALVCHLRKAFRHRLIFRSPAP